MARQSRDSKLAKARKRHLWVCYRITPEELERIEEFQRNDKVYRLLLGRKEGTDHCHKTGLIRGRLDWRINRAYGLLEKTCPTNLAEVLRALALYHEHPPAELALGEKKYGLIGEARYKKKDGLWPTDTHDKESSEDQTGAMTRNARNLRLHWQKAFQSVYEQYEEIKSTNGTSSCSGFYSGLAREGGRIALNMRVVRPSPSEFIADFELASEHALSGGFFPIFKAHYIQNNNHHELKQEVRDHLEQQVGKMLVDKRIHPTSDYFKAKDFR
jgi:hypothetical protein